MRIVFMGTPDFAVPSLEILLNHGYDIPAVVTAPDKPGGRQGVQESAVKKFAVSRGLRVLQPEKLKNPAFLEELRACRADLQVVVAFRMLPEVVWAMPPLGTLNLHGSLLPKYRGRVPVNWAVIRGERETGATLHEMVAKPDAGRIAGQEAVPIGENDTAADVFARVTDAAGRVLAKALPGLLAGTLPLVPQDLAAGSYFGGRKPADGRIDWSKPAREIHDLVRGVAPPYPGAFTALDGEPARVLGSRWTTVPGGLPGDAPAGALAVREGRAWARGGDGHWLEILALEVAGVAAPPEALASRFAARGAPMGQFTLR